MTKSEAAEIKKTVGDMMQKITRLLFDADDLRAVFEELVKTKNDVDAHDCLEVLKWKDFFKKLGDAYSALRDIEDILKYPTG
jgi:regulator of replication initiation timing